MINKICFSEYIYLSIHYLDFRILSTGIWKGGGDRGVIFDDMVSFFLNNLNINTTDSTFIYMKIKYFCKINLEI